MGNSCGRLFSNGGDGVGVGLFYGGGFKQLGIQALGIVSVAAYVLIVMFIVFKIIDKTVGLRVPAQIELDGLDIHEHGLASAYSGFAINDMTGMDMDVNENTDLGEESIVYRSYRRRKDIRLQCDESGQSKDRRRRLCGASGCRIIISKRASLE